ncbi:reticuline oxidase-like protein [Pyrus ussuriensis x Pyrus communis]|uniref:Reticuline oxidase-like protein n=1 Tax=Pyrus ussuriensis x Pyrus communis TaxID=2448454 RepID=A0A5N5I5Z4_9ROSA|nr:reticuline oxidase-like protein [Pyrus ussuriensis x Pyrus communis]
MPSRVIDFRTPLQVLTQHVQVMSTHTLKPRVFGCVAYVHIPKIHRTKLDPCALRCVFVGFSSHQKGYKCYHPETRHMYVTMDVTFSESEFFYAPVSSSSDHQGESSSGDLEWLDLGENTVVDAAAVHADAVPNAAVIIHAVPDAAEIPNMPRHESEVAAESSMQSETKDAESDLQSGQFIVEPTCVTPSLSSSTVMPNDSSLNKPEVSIVDDYVTNASTDVNTYKLPPRQNRGVPPDRFSPEGKVKYPIANYVSCNGLAPERKTLIDNMEAIRVPTRVDEALKDPKWANAMDEEMYKARLVAKGYTQTYGVDYQETFSPVAKMNTKKVTALIIYVDDMIITGDDCDEISRLQKNLAAEFEMKNLGDLKYFLGVEVARSSKGIFLSQRKYVLDLLKETGMLGCKPVDTPIVEKHHLCVDPNQKSVDKGRYQRLVGRLIYLAHTRPDIAYAVSVVSQFMHSPSLDHMAAVMRILAYLKSAPGKGVLYRKYGHLRIEGFTDADWYQDPRLRPSIEGWLTAFVRFSGFESFLRGLGSSQRKP